MADGAIAPTKAHVRAYVLDMVGQLAKMARANGDGQLAEGLDDLLAERQEPEVS